MTNLNIFNFLFKKSYHNINIYVKVKDIIKRKTTVSIGSAKTKKIRRLLFHLSIHFPGDPLRPSNRPSVLLWNLITAFRCPTCTG